MTALPRSREQPAGQSPEGRARLRFAAFLLVAILGLALLAFFGGFAVFAASVARQAAPADPHAEGIVVLTGGAERIASAIRLLAEGRANRLLISGVNPAVDARALAAIMGSDKKRYLACCIDLDHDAKDTAGNAWFTGQWADRRGYGSLIVVTSDYHMPRSLAELSDAMPGTRLVPYPVVEAGEGALAGRSRNLRLLMSEYVKFLGVRLRQFLRLPGPHPVETVSAAGSLRSPPQ